MSGPTLVIELAEAPSGAVLREFRSLMVGISSRCEEERPGFFDVHVPAGRLGIEVGREPFPSPGFGGATLNEELMALFGSDPRPAAEHRPFLVYLMGPGAGDEDVFAAEHEGEAEAEAVLGFRPTHAVNVSACCNDAVDHRVTALLAAAVMDVIGGVANAELADGQAPLVAGLPGVLGVTDDGYQVLGTAEFLRAWSGRPGFRLVK
ncbi:DUF6368 family protein [Streptomyces sp. NPDC101132]|uniref:DUF6368 family protein n=1 Tax=Streptomyces sp. NPDC101132 TaxID=3366110 RepID=UPI003814ABC2